MSAPVVVRGGASAEELAAVLAVVAHRRPVPEDPLRRWRRLRQAAVRPRSAPDRP